MDVRLPDGTIIQGVPDGISKADLTNKLVKNGYGAALSSAEDRAMADPTRDMSGPERFRAGWGKRVADTMRGAQQITGAGDQGALQQEIDQSKTLDQPLMRTPGGVAGNITGGVATYLPTLAIPGANTYLGAAALGAGQGAIEPVQTGGSRAAQAGVGAIGGAIGQGAGNVIGRAIRPVQPSLSPETQRLAQVAGQHGIPLSVGQQTGSRPLQIAESVLEQLPLTSGPQLARRQTQQEAYNAAVGGTFGSPERALTPDVFGEARRRIGQQFTDLSARNTMQADNQFITQLAQVEQNAQRYLTPDVGRVVLNRVDDVLARVENGVMTGQAYRNLDSEIGRAMRGTANGDMRHALGELRDTLRGAMDRSISAADQATWQGARRQYANMSTVAPIAGRNEAGNVSGRTLLNAANTANPNARFGGPGDLSELGRVGRSFVADQIPNSGTAQRQAAQALLTGGGGAVVGGTGAALTGNNPLEGAALGAGIMAGGIVSPRIIQALMNSPLGERYLTRGLLALSPREQRVISGVLSAAGSPALLEGQR